MFRRKSGAPLSEPLPALFTQPVFPNEVDKGIEQAVTKFAEDDWVFGAGKIDSIKKARLPQQVLALYQQDYIAAWDALLADLELQPINNIQDASAIAAKLAGPNSPMKVLLRVVRDNTHDLMRAPQDSGADKAEDVAKKAAQKKATQSALSRALAQAAGDGAGCRPAAKAGAGDQRSLRADQQAQRRRAGRGTDRPDPGACSIS